jgi:hypothetical protein
MKLPSKKLIFLFVACAISVGSIFYALKAPSKTGASVASERDSTAPQEDLILISNTVDLDSDNDGLKDWEEGIYGTNPQKADTDGDGVSDGEQYRNAQQKSAAELASKKTDTKEEAKVKNITQTFAQEIFAKYMTVKDGGVALDTKSIEELSKSFVDESSSLELTAPTYSMSDINILYHESSGDIRTYGNNLGKTLAESTPGGVANEMLVTLIALRDNNPDVLKQLDPTIAGYKKFIGGLRTMKVPEGAASYHIALLNALSQSQKSIEDMQSIFIDPIRGAPSLNNYSIGAAALSKAVQDLNHYFGENSVSFTTTEPGYTFTHAHD